jgi:type III secretion protein W
MTEIKIQSDSFVSGFQRTSDLPGGSEVDGDYRGMAVSKQEDAADMLADAAEELTFSASETVEKKTTERKKKTDMPKVSALEAAEMMAQKLKDMNPQQLQKILQQIKDAGADGAKIRQLLKDNFKEPVMQHLALSFALGQSGDDPEMKEVLEQVQKDLETEHGPEIRAGYNINPVDSSTVGTPEQARALYRGTVLGHADIGDAFTDLYNQYGDE